MPTRPRKKIAIVANRGDKDLYEESFLANNSLRRVFNKNGDKGSMQYDDILIDIGEADV